MVATVLPRVIQDIAKRTRVKFISEMRIPDKWLDYCRIGDKMKDLPIICFKTPLSEKFNAGYRNGAHGLREDEEFTPSQLCYAIRKKGLKLGMVVDLTNTYRYYDGAKEFEFRRGIKYLKIKFDAYNPESFIPVSKRFADEIESYLNTADPDTVIGVHCTHGVNRTGYMVCRYMIEKHGYNVDDAIDAFSEARGHSIEKYVNLLRDVWEKKTAEENEIENHAKICEDGETTQEICTEKSDKLQLELNEYEQVSKRKHEEIYQESASEETLIIDRNEFQERSVLFSEVPRWVRDETNQREKRTDANEYQRDFREVNQREFRERDQRDYRERDERAFGERDEREYRRRPYVNHGRVERYDSNPRSKVFHADKFYPPWKQSSSRGYDDEDSRYHKRHFDHRYPYYFPRNDRGRRRYSEESFDMRSENERRDSYKKYRHSK